MDSPEKRDIDHIIAAVREQIPNLEVRQLDKARSDDDNGLWWFSLPGIAREVQVENSFGNCPFLIETDEQCCKEALRADTVQEAVHIIVEYLREASSGRPCHIAGKRYWQCVAI